MSKGASVPGGMAVKKELSECNASSRGCFLLMILSLIAATQLCVRQHLSARRNLCGLGAPVRNGKD